MCRISFALFLLISTSQFVAAQYLNTSSQTIYSHPANAALLCDPNDVLSLTFDIETINDDALLDIVVGKTLNLQSGLKHMFQTQDFNVGDGNFPQPNGDFGAGFIDCFPLYPFFNIYHEVFGKLRPNHPLGRRDLVSISEDVITLRYNTGTTIQPTIHQVIYHGARHGSWGPFDRDDILDDLVVVSPIDTAASQIRVYINNGVGSFYDPPVNTTFSVSPTKEVHMAQIDGRVSEIPTINKWDIVGFNRSYVKVWINHGNNEINFEPSGQLILPGEVTSIVIADINNDDYNDIVVGYYSVDNSGGVAYFRNDQLGGFFTNPSWVYTTGVTTPPLVALGDFAKYGDATRTDGLSDLVVVCEGGSTQLLVKLFLNHGGASAFSSTPQQAFYVQAGGGEEEEMEDIGPVRKIKVADLRNNGGLSFVYGFHGLRPLYIIKNSVNPAPAPPTGVAISATPPDQYGYSHPKLTWKANAERDLAAYEVWRMTTGAICGTTNWSCINNNVPATQTEFIDYGIGTVMPGGDCIAKYVLKAKDLANNVSDPSSEVQINYASYFWKLGDESADKPQSYEVHAAYPNPFNPSTQIKFDLPEDGFVSLNVFDVLGRKVADVVDRNYAAGYHSVTWNASGIASGVYIARFTATDGKGNVRLNSVTKLVLAK